MRRTSAFGAALATVVALLCPSTASAGAEAAAIESLNDIRQARGLGKLRASGSLGASAGGYARRMLAHGYFGHGNRIAVAGRFRTAGETLSWHRGFGARPRATVRGWMNSPPHRAVLLSPGFRYVGMGMERGRFAGQAATMWVAHVGSM